LMAKVAFVAHCLLNQNAKTAGGAVCPGIYSPVVEELRARGWQLMQMPCPEVTFTGLNRFWAVREQYDTIAPRRHCRRIVDPLAGAISVHIQRGDEVVLIGVEGSPSMGVRITSSDPARGGQPQWAEGAPELAPGQGIFFEELRAALAERGVEAPRAIGVTEALPDHEPDAERSELGAFLET
jgi:predicted secreted protein